MGHETTIRANLAKVYVLISESVNPERMELANQKLEEVLGILSGTVPLPVITSEERG